MIRNLVHMRINGGLAPRGVASRTLRADFILAGLTISWMSFLLVGCRAPLMHVSLAESPFNPDKPAKYVIYPGDVLAVRFPTDPDLDQQMLVRSDGMISAPHVGDVQAAERSPEELSADLAQKLEGVLQKPDVTISLVEEAGRRVYLGGQVLRPGAIALKPKQSLAQALFEVGGITEMANPGGVFVLRRRMGKGTYVLQANLEQILSGRDPDILLEPYDIVHVAPSGIARVDKFVDQYINRVIPRAATFPFITELATQPVRVVDNGAAFTPVQITR